MQINKNKIAKQKIGKNNVIKEYNDLVNEAERITELRPTEPRQWTNNSEKLKNKIRQLLYSLYRSKNLQSNSIKVWLILFKNGNNLYEQWKQ